MAMIRDSPLTRSEPDHGVNPHLLDDDRTIHGFGQLYHLVVVDCLPTWVQPYLVGFPHFDQNGSITHPIIALIVVYDLIIIIFDVIIPNNMEIQSLS